MTINFFKEYVEISYSESLFSFTKKNIILKPNDILELEIGVKDANTVGKTITGALNWRISYGRFRSNSWSWWKCK